MQHFLRSIESVGNEVSPSPHSSSFLTRFVKFERGTCSSLEEKIKNSDKLFFQPFFHRVTYCYSHVTKGSNEEKTLDKVDTKEDVHSDKQMYLHEIIDLVVCMS